MKHIFHDGQFSSAELEVIAEPELKMNQHLQNVSDAEGLEEKKMYSYAKEKFNGVIPKQIIKDVVDDKFKVLTNIRIQSKETKAKKLRNLIAKGKKKIADQEESLRNMMGEPFHLITEPGGND